jgi:hypothetical protein
MQTDLGLVLERFWRRPSQALGARLLGAFYRGRSALRSWYRRWGSTGTHRTLNCSTAINDEGCSGF